MNIVRTAPCWRVRMTWVGIYVCRSICSRPKQLHSAMPHCKDGCLVHSILFLSHLLSWTLCCRVPYTANLPSRAEDPHRDGRIPHADSDVDDLLQQPCEPVPCSLPAVDVFTSRLVPSFSLHTSRLSKMGIFHHPAKSDLAISVPI